MIKFNHLIPICWHRWKYHNNITRQCLKCGKIEIKHKFLLWQNMSKDVFQKGSKIDICAETQIITIRKGSILLVPDGIQMLESGFRVDKYFGYKFNKDVTIDYQEFIKQKLEVNKIS